MEPLPQASPLPGAGLSSIFLDACGRRNRSRPPLWIMRQAGRYLPEYRELRKSHSFIELCTLPDLAVEVSMQPYRRFGFDAVIVFYDILFLAQAMGAPLEFTDAGPVFERPIRGPEDVGALHEPDLRARDPIRGTGSVLETLGRLRAQLPAAVALIGFAGAPFTVASYLVEGSFEQSGERMKRLLHEDPALARRLLERLAAATGDYLAAQVDAGAGAVQLFDTWAGLLGPDDYREFALPYTKKVFEKVAAKAVPTILYVNGGTHIIDDMASSGAAVLSIDWRTPVREARKRLGKGIALQGNLEPAALFAPPREVRGRAAAILESMRGDPAYIFNLGHGILPETPIASVEALVAVVKGE